MNLRASLSLFALLLLPTASACRHATPVTPAPLSMDQAAALRASIVGEWKWVKAREADGDLSDPGGDTTFKFGADGTLRYVSLTSLVALDQTYKWDLDGAHVRTTHPGMPVLRADVWTANHLELFWYDSSVTILLDRKGAQ